MKTLTILIFIATLFLFVDSKVLNQKVARSPLKGETWNVLTRFVTAEGQGSYSFKIWNQSPKKGADQEIPITLHLFTMENWKQQKQEITCHEKAKYSSFNTSLTLPLNGTPVSIPSTPFGEKDQVQIWYFVLASCNDAYTHILLHSNNIRYELDIKNVDGSHISEEEKGISTVLIFTIIPIFVFFVFNSVKMLQFYTSKAALDYPLVMLLVSLILEFLSLSSEYLHLYTYSQNGSGFFLFDWASAVFSNLSQFLISLLFLLMATGWTVKTLNKKEEELFVIIGTIAGILIIIVAITGKISKNDLDSFHDYENWTGLVTLFIKLVLYFLFGNQVLNNYEKSDKKLKRHFTKLGIFGSIYLLSFPLTVIAADFLLPAYLRHKATTYVLIISQTATLLVYASLLSFKEGEYYPIVYKSRTILPMSKIG